MDYCDEHKTHEDRLNRAEKRLDSHGEKLDDISELMAKMGAILEQLQKLYWAFITAMVGSVVVAMFALITTR